MPTLDSIEYARRRNAYNYEAPLATLAIVQTMGLPYVGVFSGIFARTVPAIYPNGINIRKLEAICASVFDDALSAHSDGKTNVVHRSNVRAVTLAVVHWKMSSQGGRAAWNVENVRAKWNQGGVDTHEQLMQAHRGSSLCEYRIGGVRIPTASALLRFTRPDTHAIVDRRIVNNHTNPAGMTRFRVRKGDGYITDSDYNVHEYTNRYSAFLAAEATRLNTAGVTFSDVDASGNILLGVPFRPCDVDMALYM